MKWILGIIVFVCFGALGLNVFSQAVPTSKPSFEVASIKLNQETAPGMRGGNCRGTDSPAPATPPPPPTPSRSGAAPAREEGRGGPAPTLIGGPQTPIGRCVFTRTTLSNLIFNAYQPGARGVPANQAVIGGPFWVNTDTFDVNAKAEDPATTLSDLRRMLQSLLEDRFKLKTHTETREVSGFALVVAKGGSKLKPPDGTEQRTNALMLQIQGNPSGSGPVATLTGQMVGISNMLGMLASQLQRPVEDKTGLTGVYSFTMTYTPDLASFGGLAPLAASSPDATASDPGGNLISALQEQLGLRIETEKVSISILVIDSVDRVSDDGARNRRDE